jgi:hypothetical protein
MPISDLGGSNLEIPLFPFPFDWRINRYFEFATET